MKFMSITRPLGLVPIVLMVGIAYADSPSKAVQCRDYGAFEDSEGIWQNCDVSVTVEQYDTDFYQEESNEEAPHEEAPYDTEPYDADTTYSEPEYDLETNPYDEDQASDINMDDQQ